MTIRLRPRFEFVAPHRPEEVAQALRSVIEGPTAAWPGRVFADHAVIHVPKEEQRLWSPFLSVDFAPHPDGSTIRGLFGPKPSIWTLFAASYAVCVFGAFFALALAWAQYAMGTAMWGFWLLPIMAAGGAMTYAAALYGQHNGHDQMDGLRSVLEGALSAELQQT